MPESPATLPAEYVGLVDDAAIFPPGNSPLEDAVKAFAAREEKWYAEFVGSFVVRDVDAPRLDRPLPLSIVVTGGAGAIAGALAVAAKGNHRVVGLEIALRDLDDLPGNARRVAAAVDDARREATFDESTPVHVELPHVGSTGAWLAAADEVAVAGLRLKFRTGGTEAEAFPPAHMLARWIDAALDRETPFKCTAGLHHATRHRDRDTGFEHHGFLNVLVATRHAFDGAGLDDVVRILDEQSEPELVALAHKTELSGGRRWFTSFGSCSVTEPLEELIATGLLEDA